MNKINMKISKKAIWLILLSLLHVVCIYAQDLETVYKDIEILSPEAYEFMKYGNVNNNMFKGTPEISIPIYNIEGKEMDMPIALYYDASGIKVNQQATEVGLGWSLYTGGMITRVINGKPDHVLNTSSSHYGSLYSHYHEIKPFFGPRRINSGDIYHSDSSKPYPMSNLLTYLQYEAKILDGEIDEKPDFFNVSVGNINTSIYIDPETHEAKCTNGEEFKVSFTGDLGTFRNGGVEQWRITDNEGTIYFFDAFDTSRTVGTDTERFEKVITSWHLTQIASPNYKDLYKFSYQKNTYKEDEISVRNARSIRSDAIFTSEAIYCKAVLGSQNDKHIPFMEIERNILQSIKRNDKEIVKFHYADVKRKDIKTGEQLEKIEIENGKTYQLGYSYFKSNVNINVNQPNSFKRSDIRLKLDEITVATHNNYQNKYSFEYFNPNDVPNTESFSQDLWGYFNGRQNANLIPAIKFEYNNENFDFKGADRSVNISKAINGTLKKITYPTGGSTIFEYESNKYFKTGNLPKPLANGSHINIGGLRVKKIIDFQTNGVEALKKTYIYNDVVIDENNNKLDKSSANLRYHPLYFHYNKYSKSNLKQDCHYFTRHSNPINYQDQYQIGYSKVTEIIDQGSKGGYKEFYFYNNNKGQYYFENPFNVNANNHISEPFTDKKTGKLKEELFYDDQNNLLQKTEYLYETSRKRRIGKYNYIDRGFWSFNNSSKIYGRISDKMVYHRPDGYSFSLPLHSHFQLKHHTIGHRTVLLFSDLVLLSKVTNEYYYDSETVKSTTNLFYEKLNPYIHSQKTRTDFIDSKGDTLTTKYFYPKDITSVESIGPLFTLSQEEFEAIESLKQRNKLITPLKKEYYKNNEFIEAEIIKFKNQTFVSTFPSKVQIFKKNALENKIVFHKYFRGNPIEISEGENIHTFYVWGYNSEYIIAKIENYISETKTTEENLQRNRLINGAVIASNSDEELQSMESEDKLRDALTALQESVLFKDSMITTYTYDPLIGMTSQTDPKGYTTSYKYDVHNRLHQVKDHEGNIINEYNYNYKD